MHRGASFGLSSQPAGIQKAVAYTTLFPALVASKSSSSKEIAVSGGIAPGERSMAFTAYIRLILPGSPTSSPTGAISDPEPKLTRPRS